MPRHRGHHPIQSHHPSESHHDSFTHRQVTSGCFSKKITRMESWRSRSGFLRNWSSCNCTKTPPFSISFLLKPLSQLPEWWHVVEADTQRPDFSFKKDKAGFKQTKQISAPKWHFEGLKGYMKDMSNPSPACHFFDTTKSFSEFCEGAWHESFQKSPVKQWSKLPHLQVRNLGCFANGMSSTKFPNRKKHQP